MDICFTPFERAPACCEAAFLDDVPALEALCEKEVARTCCCTFNHVGPLELCLWAASLEAFKFLVFERGLRLKRGWSGPIDLVSHNTHLCHDDLVWQGQGLPCEQEPFRSHLEKDREEQRSVLSAVLERGYFVRRLEWSKERLLWLGRTQDDCLLSRLPKELVRMIVAEGGVKVFVYLEEEVQ